MSEPSVFSGMASSQEWYTKQGPDNDVVLSTRIRISRNLADFPFPQKFKNDDSVRVQTLVFDSILKNDKSSAYQTLAVASLNNLGAQMLLERGLIEHSTLNSPGAGIVMKLSGEGANSGLVCTINDIDHVRISCFVPGLDCNSAYKECEKMDEILQKGLQFAASYDFGYLTSCIKDSGSGMKISCRVHLPSIAFLNEIPKLFESLYSKGIVAEPAFGMSAEIGASIGSFYQLSSCIAGNGSELEQIANFTGNMKAVIELERKSRDTVLQKRTTEVTNQILKSYSLAKFCLLFDLRDSIKIISDIKWGKNLDLIKEIDDSELTSLIYRVQESHLKYVIKNGNYNFPMDISANEKKQVERFRSLILQDTFEHLKICE